MKSEKEERGRERGGEGRGEEKGEGRGEGGEAQRSWRGTRGEKKIIVTKLVLRLYRHWTPMMPH